MANPHEDAELELLDLAQLEEAPPQLVRYLVSNKALNVATVIRMLRQAWQEIGWTHLEPIQAYHTFSITAENAKVAQILRERSPWSFMGCSFGIHTWPQEAQLKDLPLHMIAFWVFCSQMKEIDGRSIDQSSFMYGDWMRARVVRRILPPRILNNVAPVEPLMEIEA
ncbi:hypothetical protein ACLB2K_037601 [Fragaria x ananassa]